MRKRLFAGLAVLLLSAAPTLAQTHAFTGAHIIPIDGPEIENGTLIIEDGRIVDVGPAGQVDVPRRAERHDVKGMVIMPGLVDTHSHIGDGSGADRSAPIQPDVRVMDSINPRDSGFQKSAIGWRHDSQHYAWLGSLTIRTDVIRQIP